MYTLLITLFLYPENARGEQISGQHTICFHILLCFSRNTVPIGFCCGGFSSTAGYVPGNEAHLAMSDFCSLPGGSLPKSVFRFYPENPEKVLQPFLELSLSASIQSVIVTFFPSFCYSRTMRHRSVRLSLYRSKARKHF